MYICWSLLNWILKIATFILRKLHPDDIDLKSKTDHYVICDAFTTLNKTRCLSFLCCSVKASIKSIRVYIKPYNQNYFIYNMNSLEESEGMI